MLRAHIANGALQGPEKEIMNLALLAEAHLVLGGVDVHIHRIRGQIQEEHESRMATVVQHIAIGLTHSVGDHPILYGSAIDKKVLEIGLAPGKGGLGHPAVEPQPVPAAI